MKRQQTDYFRYQFNKIHEKIQQQTDYFRYQFNKTHEKI